MSAANAAAPERLPRGLLITFVLAVGAGLGLLGVAVKTAFTPRPTETDIAAGAWRMLERGNVTPLAKELSAVLADWPRLGDRTDEHPLLGQPAPDFALATAAGGAFRLSDALRDGPVVAVFYYGYYCDHCVSQLFALERERRYFDQLGAKIVAISADAPETTREQFARYRGKGGAFGFAVASDPDKRIAERYGCFRKYEPGPPAKTETQLHGTFVIDRQGIVRWAKTGPGPYANVRSLLGELAALRPGKPELLQPKP